MTNELNAELFQAVEDDDIGKVRLLLDQGVDVDVKHKYGGTALMSACHNGSYKMVKLLLDWGANINAQDECDGYTPLMWACAGKRTEVVKLLLDRGADVNLQDNEGQTALMMACKFECVEIEQLLLDRGADVNLKDKVKDKAGNIALMFTRAMMFASRFEKPSIAELIASKTHDEI